MLLNWIKRSMELEIDKTCELVECSVWGRTRIVLFGYIFVTKMTCNVPVFILLKSKSSACRQLTFLLPAFVSFHFHLLLR